MLEAYQPLNLLQGPRGERQGNAERKRAQSLSLRKLFKPFLQIRERDDLIVVFVIHCSINCYDNQTKNHCSERDPPRLRSEHKFYGISLLISLYTVICIYRKLSRDVPVFAQIGAAGSQTNQADSNKPDAIRQNLQRQNHG